MKKYLITTTERWSFHEVHTYKKDNIFIELTDCCKYGSIVIHIHNDDILPIDEFDSDNYTKPDQFYIEETGDEEFVDVEVYSDNLDETHDEVYDWLDNEYDDESEEYWNRQEFLELNGWEYVSSRYYFDSPELKEINE